MAISVLDPIGPAIDRTKLVLFQPFDFVKWLKLGFCAFLMTLGEGGSSPNVNTGNTGGGGGGSGPDFKPVTDWIGEHLVIVIVVVAVVILVSIAIGLLLLWLSSRGRFMFLDGVVRNRGAVIEPWREYRREGNSLFLFRVCLGLVGLLVVMLILGLCVLVALPDIQNEQFGGFAVGAILLAIVLFLVFGLAMAVIGLFLMDFVVPIMYLRRIKVLDAWGEFYGSMLAGHPGTFVLYFLMKILIGIVVAMVAVGLLCLTCCLAAIPYVGTVLMLPLFVFVQAYPLYLIEQFGPKWRVFPVAPIYGA